MGDRPDVRRNLGRGGLRVLHHRRVLADDRRLARRRAHAHADGPRRDRDGPLEPRAASCRAALPLRCRVAVHLYPLRRAAGRDRRGPLDRNRRRQLRQRAGRDRQRLLQGRADPRPDPHGPWKTVEEVELATLGWVHWHNTQRLHGYLGDLPPAEFEELHAARQALNPGVLSVAPPARKPAERLPQPPPDAIEGEIASEPPLQPSPVTAPALTASAALPEDATPDRAMARWNNNINTNHLTAQPEEDYATRQADTVLA